MSTVAALLGRAVAAHRAGQVAAAAAMYRDVLSIDPNHAQAAHLLGFALLQQGAPSDALPLLAAALRRAPESPDTWAHLGLALGELRRTGPAVAALRRAQLLAPALLEAAAGLVRVIRDSGRAVPEAVAVRAVMLAPLRASGWHGLGLVRTGPEGGDPDPGDGWACLRRAVLIDPADRPATADLADAQRSRRDPESARRVGHWAVRLGPYSSVVRATLAAALFDLDRVVDAGRAACAAAVLDPGNAKAYVNRAQCLYRTDRFAAAIADGLRAVAADPENPQIRANLASYRLASGDLERGWPLFRDRPAGRILARSPGLPAARWSGEPDARLLVLAEQGLGDELLFANCWPDLAARLHTGGLAAGMVELDPRLRPLAARSCPGLQWADRDRSGRLSGAGPAGAAFGATHWIAAGDLPAILRHHVKDFPTAPPVLRPDPARVEGFRRWLDEAAPGVPRIGLCWRSGLRTGDRRKHYPELSECGALLRSPGLRIVVLQYDDCAREIAAAVGPDDTGLLVPPGLDRRDDLDGVAALIAALDGVVSAETAVLALAGAIGAPTVGFGLGAGWVALGQPGLPWFPTVRTRYRRAGEDWESLMARVACDARALAAKTKEPGGNATRPD